MRPLLSTLAFLIVSACLGQYSNPYRIAFDGNNYFITNHGDGTVSKLDGSFNKSTVISGLTTPNDIFFGAVGMNSAIIVIDTNKLKLYDPSSFGSLIEVDITFATEAHDGIVNPSNNNEFYVGDRAGNKIIKGTIGPPPFYPISFTVLVQNITKPAGMIFNDSNQLIVVSDTIDGSIYQINTASGSVTTRKTTSIDNMNDISQDNEGNYYISNWGDNKLYRFDVNFNNQTALTTHNNPAGLFTNYSNDFLVLACHGCGTLEFKNFHLFAPLADVSTCENDSFIVDFSPTFNGIGTYSTSNKFLVEMSDSNGSFTSPIQIGSVTSSSVPSFIKCGLPSSKYASFGHKYRLKSTSPAHDGFGEKNLFITSTPNALITGVDTLVLCSGTSVVLGPPNVAGNTYQWLPDSLVSNDSIAQPLFSATTPGDFQLNLAVTTSSGCLSKDSAIINVSPNLSIPSLLDSISMCKGDTANLGHAGLPYIFNWSGTPNMIGSTSANPKYFGDSSLQVYVNFSDSASSCAGRDSVFVSVNEGRELFFPLENPQFCLGQMVNIDMSFDTSFSYSFFAELPLNSTTEYTAQYATIAPGNFDYSITYTDKTNGCSRIFNNYGIVHDIVDTISIEYNPITERIEANLFGETGTVSWYINDTLFASGTTTIDRYEINSGDSVRAVAMKNPFCLSHSNVLLWSTAGIREIQNSFIVYPNPSSDYLHIESYEPIYFIKIYDAQGKSILETQKTFIDVNAILPGLYFVRVHTHSGVGTQQLIID